MGTKLMMQECSESCKDQCEFSLMLAIQKLVLTDKEKDRGFEDISLVVTMDSNVMKLDNIQSADENVNLQRQVIYQTTPEAFAKKLKKSPIFINLSRECAELGTIKLEITDCFSDAVLSGEFSSEKMTCDYTFVKDNTENASMELTIEVSKIAVDNEAMKDFLRSNSKRRDRQRNKARSVIEQYESSLSSDDALSSFMCDADLLQTLCPLEHERNGSSTNTKHSKCLSDIAASLDINKFADTQKTFCRGCRGYSISGVTCENKEILSKNNAGKGLKKSSSFLRKPSHIEYGQKDKCSRPVNRICSECFADLTILPKDVSCPNCCCKNKKKSAIEPARKKKGVYTDSSNNYFQNMLKAICVDEKTKTDDGFEHKKDANVKCKNKRRKNGKGRKKQTTTLSRCCKVKRGNEASKIRNKTLRIKHHGVLLGHKDCKCESLLVPKNMGWLWNVKTPGISEIRRGWKPGAVPQSVARMMKFFLKKECEPPADRRVVNEKLTSTLKVEKKLGEYKITLNPLCGGDTPITFKIQKSENEQKRWNARKMLKCRGITKKCNCNNINSCGCMNDCQKQRTLFELKAISQEFCLCPEMKYEELNDTSGCSEIDFEFTPPIEMANKCKRNMRVSVAATQYEDPNSEKYDETEESSENEIAVIKKKKKKVKKNVNKTKKKIQNSSGLRSAANLCELRDIEPTKCVINCKSNFVTPQCEFGDRSTTNYNPLYQRCIPNYSTCPPQPACCQHWHNCFDSFNY